MKCGKNKKTKHTITKEGVQQLRLILLKGENVRIHEKNISMSFNYYFSPSLETCFKEVVVSVEDLLTCGKPTRTYPQ